MTTLREAKQATPHEHLISELLDSRVPKNEREHAAGREIERLREAAALALEALEDARQGGIGKGPVREAITALRAALADHIVDADKKEGDNLAPPLPEPTSQESRQVKPEPRPCPTCVALARAVMMDQTGNA